MDQVIKVKQEECGRLDAEIQRIADTAAAEKRDITAEEFAKVKELNSRESVIRGEIDELQKIATRSKLVNEQHNLPGPSRDVAGVTEERRAAALQTWARVQAQRNVTADEIASARSVGVEPFSAFAFGLAPTNHIRSYTKKLNTRHYTRHEEVEYRALTTANGTVPEGFIRELEVALLTHGPMLQIADVRTTEKGESLPWPNMNDTGNEGVLRSQGATIGSDTVPTISQITLGAHSVTSLPALISWEMLEDSAFDMAAELGAALGERIGRRVNRSLTVGTGTTDAWGVIERATVGVTAAATYVLRPEEIIQLYHSVDPAYRVGARFMLNDKTIASLRILKDSDGRFLWADGLKDGVPDTLLGVPVSINQHMDGINDETPSAGDNGEKVIAFGNFKKYKARVVRGIRTTRFNELFAQNGYIGFQSDFRFDGDLQDAGTHPIKVLRMKS